MAIRLILVHDDQTLGVELRDGVYVIGRDDRAEIVVPNGTVSSRHAELRVNGDACVLRDLGSSNGTFVNGIRISSPTAVTSADAIALGSARMSIALPGTSGAAGDPTAQMRAYQSPSPASSPNAPVAGTKGSSLSFTLRLWLVGALTIMTLVVLLLLAQVYGQGQARRAQLGARYMALAYQYIHVLKAPRTHPLPAPVFDHWLALPVLVLDADGQIVYPQPPAEVAARRSPLADPKTGVIPERAKTGLFGFPMQVAGSPIRVNSYPVIYQGELLGYVVARPGVIPSNSMLIALITFCAAAIALLLLYVLIRPVTSAIRANIEMLTAKVTALSHGIVDSLPRGNTIPELDVLAAEIEAMARVRATPQAGPADSTHGSDAVYGAYFPSLVDSARLPYCFVNGDFHLLKSNRQLAALQELAHVRRGVSIFDAGMTNLQSKQLIRALNDARTAGEGEASLQFMVGGETKTYTVFAKKFAGVRGDQVFGLLFRQSG